MHMNKELKTVIAIFSLILGLATLGFAIYIRFFSMDTELYRTSAEKSEYLSWAMSSAWPFIVIGVIALTVSRQIFKSLRPRKNYLRRWEDAQESLGKRNAQLEATRLSNQAYANGLAAYMDGKTTGYRR